MPGDIGGLGHAAERDVTHRVAVRLLSRGAGRLGDPVEALPGHVGVDPAGADRVHLDVLAGATRRRESGRARGAQPSRPSSPVYPGTAIRARIEEITTRCRASGPGGDAAEPRGSSSRCRRDSSRQIVEAVAVPSAFDPPRPLAETSAVTGPRASTAAAKAESTSLRFLMSHLAM